jgi:hypothetical protein
VYSITEYTVEILLRSLNTETLNKLIVRSALFYRFITVMYISENEQKSLELYGKSWVGQFLKWKLIWPFQVPSIFIANTTFVVSIF